MMKKDKSKHLAVFLVLLTIVVVTVSFLFNNASKESNNKVHILNNPSNFFTVNSCLYRTTTYIFKKDTSSLLKILDEDYKKKNNINKGNILNIFPEINDDSTFVSKKMYYQTINSNITKYYVSGVIEKNIIHDYTTVEKNSSKEIYFIVVLNSKKQVFSVQPYDGELFMDGEKDE